MATDLNAAFDAIGNVLPGNRERQLALSLLSHIDLRPDARSLQRSNNITLLDENDEPIILTREDLIDLRMCLTRLGSFQAEMRQFSRRNIFQRLPTVTQTSDFF